MKNSNKLMLAIGLSVAVVMPVQAAMVTMNGTDVSFTYDNASQFGLGTVVGNSIFFQPTNFKAESTNGAGTVLNNEVLIIDVVSLNNSYKITSLAMVEQGDYTLTGAGSSANASGRLGVTSTTSTCGGLFACNDSGLFDTGNLTTSGLNNWSGSTSVDLADTAGWGSDTSLAISFQNNLRATTVTGTSPSSALIQKKQGGIGLVVNPVPVPAAVWLFGSGLLGLAAFTRRKLK